MRPHFLTPTYLCAGLAILLAVRPGSVLAAPLVVEESIGPDEKPTAADREALKQLEATILRLEKEDKDEEEDEDFCPDLQRARKNFPLISVGTQIGKPIWRKHLLNARPFRLDAFRFTVPPGKKNYDLYWLYVLPFTDFSWQILPAKGRGDGPSLRYVMSDLQLEEPILPGRNNAMIQSLTNGRLKAGEEYILYFRFKDTRPVMIHFAFVMVPEGTVPQTEDEDKRAIRAALDLKPKGLQWKAYFGMDREVRAAIEADPKLLTRVDETGWAPLTWAAREDRADLCTFLLDKGADINARDYTSWTPLMQAARYSSFEAVKVLLKRGAQVNLRTNEGLDRAALAVVERSPEMVELLLDAKADPNITNYRNLPPLHVAIRPERNEIFQLLADRGARLTLVDGFGDRCMHRAVHFDRQDVLELLLERKVSVDCRDASQQTPLMRAAAKGNLKMADLLLARGADPKALARGDTTALHLAADAGQSSVARLLVEKGADVNARMNEGATPLLFTVARGHLECCQVLLEAKADPNLADLTGNAPLKIAESRQQTALAELLRKHGAK